MQSYRSAVYWLSLGGLAFFAGAATLMAMGFNASWYGSLGAALLMVGTILSAMHFVAAWQVFYGGNRYWRAFGHRRMWLRFILVPILYCFAYYAVSAWLWENFFHWKLLVFWLLICIPNTFHNLGQDRGILTILHGDAPRESLLSLRSCLLYLVFPAVMLIRTREILRTAGEGSVWLAPVQLGLLCLGVALGAVLAWKTYQWVRRGLAGISALYLGAVGSWCAYPILRLVSGGAVSAISATSTVRHSVLYLMLANRVVTGAEGVRSRWNSVWVMASLFGIPLGILFGWAEIRVFADLYNNGARPQLGVWGPEFLFFTLHGLVALHHFDVEAYAWRFGDEKTGAVLRERLAGW